MTAFIDTSSLIKKYIQEEGSDEFDTFLNKVSTIIVAPIYFLEINSAVERRLTEHSLSLAQANHIRQEATRDVHFFHQIIWNENLQQKTVEVIRKHQLKTLDSLQLASGCLSDADIFVVSDKTLYNKAKIELRKALFI